MVTSCAIAIGFVPAEAFPNVLTPYFGNAGYLDGVVYGPRRDVGVTFRYSMGRTSAGE